MLPNQMHWVNPIHGLAFRMMWWWGRPPVFFQQPCTVSDHGWCKKKVHPELTHRRLQKTPLGKRNQLVNNLTDILNNSLTTTIVPTCVKATNIITMTSKTSVSCQNDYCLHLHLDNNDTYVQMSIIDYSSWFNIFPKHLTKRLSLLGLNTFPLQHPISECS